MQRIFLMIILCLTANLSYAFNTDFLTYSPVFYFTSQDNNIMQNAAMQALNRARDNTKITWSNPQTGAHGYIIPIETQNKNRMRCRTLRMFNEANHVTGESVHQFCKVGNEWKIKR